MNPIDGGLTPETVLAAWHLAAQNKHDGVIATGFPWVMYADPLAELHAAGIPVVLGYVTETPTPRPASSPSSPVAATRSRIRASTRPTSCSAGLGRTPTCSSSAAACSPA